MGADTDTLLLGCRESGRLAFSAGIKFKDCPFAKDSMAETAWQVGWLDEWSKDQGLVRQG